MDIGKWLDRGLDKGEPNEKTIRAQELAERMGYSNGTYLYKFINGERKLSKKRIAIAAEYFGEPDPTSKQPPASPAPKNKNNIIVMPTARSDMVPHPICGVVEAGAFREIDLVSQVEPQTVSLPRDDLYPNASPMAWEVRGDSMDQKALIDGTIAYGVDFQETGLPLQNGMIVVVEQNRGGLIERSIKAVTLFSDRIEFQPRSNNPIHRPIVYKNGDSFSSDAEVRVLTLIRGSANRY